MERSGLTFEHFCLKMVKKSVETFFFERLNYSLINFARVRRLYNKDQEVLQQGSGGY